MASTLHNITALSNHMNNEDSFIWIAGQIQQSNFSMDSYNTKNTFLDQWNDIDTKPENTRICKTSSHKNTKKNCIVKVYKLQENNKNILNEMAHIKSTYLLMQKTNLLNYYGLYYNKPQNQLFITMEPLKQTLEQYVSNRSTIREIECKLIISYLLYDLWTLHKTGFIHSDINPSNIMLRDSIKEPTLNGWRLIDYDNRLFIGNKIYVPYKRVRGCVQWTPPEHKYNIKKKKEFNYFNYGTDVWSIGLIILYILTGKNPYQLTKEEQLKYSNSKKIYQQYFYYNKLLKNDKYKMDSHINKGEIWLRNYLISLYFQDKISYELFDLLHDYILIFDPRKR
eukprot:966541_1